MTTTRLALLLTITALIEVLTESPALLKKEFDAKAGIALIKL
jgi:hypothetical protein